MIKEDREINDMMNAMLEIMKYQDDPKVGSFWYDPNRDELFGVCSMLAQCAVPYKSELGEETRTGTLLHEQIWEKEHFKGKDKRFQGDHTLVPCGRVFQIGKDFVVMVGNWIDDYPSAKEEILFEFDLPKETEFRKDTHWDIGHEWSNMGLDV